MAQLKEGSIIKKVSGNQFIATKEDVDAKIAEKVKTNVPSGAKFTDTVYSHPATHSADMITGLPTSLPASGGNADTVSGFIVGTNVPTDAKFTDTIYTHPSTHPYSMITGVPTSLPANGGNSDTSKGLIGDDTRDINSPPSEYMNGGSRYIGRAGWQTEFKRAAIIGVSSYLSGTYCYLETKNPWSDPSGGYPVQIAYGNGTPCWRVGVSTTAWSSWKLLGDNLHIGSSPPSDNTTHWIDTSI